jgi:hypothetical protein
MIALWI